MYDYNILSYSERVGWILTSSLILVWRKFENLVEHGCKTSA